MPYILVEFEKFKPNEFMNEKSLNHFIKPLTLGTDILKLAIRKQLEQACKIFLKYYSNYSEEHPLYSSLGDILSVKYYFDFYYFADIDLNFIKKKDY
jgi:hypothetical protein